MRKALLSTLMLLFSICVFAYDCEVDGIYYNLNKKDCTASVTYKSLYDGANYSGVVHIPTEVTYNGTIYSVTSIDDAAFYWCKGLTEVTIPNSVTSIGNYAFYGCSGLTKLTIGNSVTSIGDDAFEDCSGLTEVTIPNSVTSIGRDAFNGCSGLTELTIGNSVTSIGRSAFYGCSGLTKVNISDLAAWCKISFADSSNPLYYAHHLYLNSEEIKKIVIPNSVTSISDYAFDGCSGLTELTIPNSVTSIGMLAFRDCSGLTEVTIGNSVISIGSSAFAYCTGLTEVTIPNSMTYIGYSAFSNCNSLKELTLSEGEGILEFYTTYDSNPFSGCPIEKLYLGRDVIYSSYYSPFRNNKSLTSLTIGNSVTSIGEQAFSGCSSLIELTLSDGEGVLEFSTSYNSNPFSGCPIEKLYLGRDVIYSSYYSPFRDNESLTSLTIGNSVTSIGDFTFAGCSSLTELIIPNSVTSIGEQAFSGCSSLIKLTLSDGEGVLEFYTKYKSAPFSGCPIEKLYLGRDVSYYSSYSPFRDNESLTNLTIGNSVTSIGNSAFYRCTGLTELTIPNSTTFIGYSAFYDCNGLTELTIGNGVTTIGEHAFYGCSGLKELSIPNSVTSIGRFIFYGCSGLKELSIPNSVTYIGEMAFRGCSGLTKLIIPCHVSYIDDGAFEGCKGLISVISLNTTPPNIHIYTMTSSAFDAETYQNATLHVPAGCGPSYRAAKHWKNFKKIQSDASTGIEPVNIDKQGKNVIYTLDGVKLNTTNVSDLPAGIYIVNGKKIIVK